MMIERSMRWNVVMAALVAMGAWLFAVAPLSAYILDPDESKTFIQSTHRMQAGSGTKGLRITQHTMSGAGNGGADIAFGNMYASEHDSVAAGGAGDAHTSEAWASFLPFESGTLATLLVGSGTQVTQNNPGGPSGATPFAAPHPAMETGVEMDFNGPSQDRHSGQITFTVEDAVNDPIAFFGLPLTGSVSESEGSNVSVRARIDYLKNGSQIGEINLDKTFSTPGPFSDYVSGATYLTGANLEPGDELTLELDVLRFRTQSFSPSSIALIKNANDFFQQQDASKPLLSGDFYELGLRNGGTFVPGSDNNFNLQGGMLVTDPFLHDSSMMRFFSGGGLMNLEVTDPRTQGFLSDFPLQPPTSGIPEPAMATLLGIGAAAMLRRRRGG